MDRRSTCGMSGIARVNGTRESRRFSLPSHPAFARLRESTHARPAPVPWNGNLAISSSISTALVDHPTFFRPRSHTTVNAWRLVSTVMGEIANFNEELAGIPGLSAHIFIEFKWDKMIFPLIKNLSSCCIAHNGTGTCWMLADNVAINNECQSRVQQDHAQSCFPPANQCLSGEQERDGGSCNMRESRGIRVLACSHRVPPAL